MPALALDPSRPWPRLNPHALHGLAGEFVRAMQPHTEADPAGLLIQFLVTAGILLGRRAGIRVGRGVHYPNLYSVLVGGTGGLGRKGTSFADVRAFFQQVEPVFVKERITSGLSSGEGFLMEVRDRITKTNEKGELIVLEEGVADKRTLWFEAEFSNVLAVKGRDGNTLSSHLRNGWDGWGVLKVATKNSQLRATDAHIGLIGHITPYELSTCLSEGDAFNGFANRILFACVKASQRLPFGGPNVPLPVLADRLRQRVAFCDHLREIDWSDGARPLWIELYDQIRPVQDGLVTALSSRAEAQLVRLCLIYALLDESPVVSPLHVLAAKAVWDYCKASLDFLFGAESSLVDPFKQILFDLIQSKPGINRHRLDAEMSFPPRMKLASALIEMEEQGLVSRARERRGPEGGRPAECFYPVTQKPSNELVTGEVTGLLGKPGDTAAITSQDQAEGVTGRSLNRFPGLLGRQAREMTQEELHKAVDDLLSRVEPGESVDAVDAVDAEFGRVDSLEQAGPPEEEDDPDAA